MSKKFQEWHTLKENLHYSNKKVLFKEREIFWASVGVNIGFEQDGKGHILSRPLLILKKYNNNLFFGIPLSTKIKEGTFFFDFQLNGKDSSALLVQGRTYDAKRLENKMGMIAKDDFDMLKIKLRELLNV